MNQLLHIATLSLWLAVQCAAMRPALAAPAGAAASAQAVQGAASDVQRLEAEQHKQLLLKEAELRAAAREAQEIGRLKEQTQSVARDLELQRLLAQAQGRASTLSEKDVVLGQLAGQLQRARQQLLRAFDAQLALTGLSSTQRLDLLRLRAAQVERLAEPHKDAATSALLRQATQAEGEVAEEDPQRLKERADLLRDSADKVQRELVRLEQRSEELVRRTKMRERAQEVDQDMFAEQVTTRRTAQGEQSLAGNNKGTSDAAAGAPDAPPRVGAEAAPQPQPPSQIAPPTRSAFDPATLDLLRKAEASSNPEVRLQAIRRAQKELRSLADQLGRRASSLERRAEEMRRRK